MKTHIIKPLLMLLIFISCKQAIAQNNVHNSFEADEITPYRLKVTYDKTTHLIFPTSIRYVDLGSENLIAEKPEETENILRVKAAIRNFERETNFSVVTDDGKFYNFNVNYSFSPEVMTYNLSTIQNKTIQQQAIDIQFEELGEHSVSMIDLLMKTIIKKNKRIIKHIGSKKYGIVFQLKSVYIQNGRYYFHTEINNKSNIPFQVDMINFKIKDKKIAKRTVIQEHVLVPLRTYVSKEKIEEQSKDQSIFMFDTFSIDDEKVLIIELFEKNGSRHQILQIENSDLIRAQLISDMHIQF